MRKTSSGLALVTAAAGFSLACGSSDGGTGNSGGFAASSAGGSAANGAGGSSANGSGGSLNLGGQGGDAAGSSGGSSASGGGSGFCGTNLTGTLRDFRADHPDFEDFLGGDKGIVADTLGADDKPVYAGNPTTATTTGKANFDQWYNDVAGINSPLPWTITLSAAGGNVYTYDQPEFFPLDGQAFGNEGNPHNYHFTFELHTQFEYRGGETFTFTGDDDLFAYINGKLAINLGGVHGAETDTINLDNQASALGIGTGTIYPLDIFSAERHTSESHFRIDTTIASFTNCGAGPH